MRNDFCDGLNTAQCEFARGIRGVISRQIFFC